MLRGNVYIYTDGSFSPHRNNGGYAFKIISDEEVITSWGGADTITYPDVMYMEILAVNMAMETLLREDLSSVDSICVYSDNEGIVSFINKNAVNTADEEHEPIYGKMLSYIRKAGAKCRHVKAHTKSKDEQSIQNHWCDTYANAGRVCGGRYIFKRRIITGGLTQPMITVCTQGKEKGGYAYAIEINTGKKYIRAYGMFKNDQFTGEQAAKAAIANMYALAKAHKIKVSNCTVCVCGDMLNSMESALRKKIPEDNPLLSNFHELIGDIPRILRYPYDEDNENAFNGNDFQWVMDACGKASPETPAKITIEYKSSENML